ncbi:MAG: ion channel [Pseudomonadota bacterium]
MSLTLQIFWGSALLLACTILHAGMLMVAIRMLARLIHRLDGRNNTLRWTIPMMVIVIMIVAAHTIQVWIWAFALIFSGVMSDFEEAAYYAIVTYTTVGFGDVVLPESHRIFGAMASVSGLLSFGLSTASLVTLFTRLLPRGLQ